MIGGTTRSTPAFGSSLNNKEEGNDEEDEIDEENGVVGGRVFAL